MKEDFTSAFNREVLSLLKWIFIIGFAAVVFYVVTPKYVLSSKGNVRMNRITGAVRELIDVDKKGVFHFND